MCPGSALPPFESRRNLGKDAWSAIRVFVIQELAKDLTGRSCPMALSWRNWLPRLRINPYARRQPLVLLNGLAEQAESWFRNQPFWRRHFEVYVPNLLVYDGPALHQRIEEGLPISVDYLVEQLHVYLESFVQTPPYHLVAASLGGKIAVEYAVRYPDRIARLVLLCPSGMGDEERLPIVDGVRRNDPRSLVESVFYDPEPRRSALLRYYQRQFANRRWRLGLLRTRARHDGPLRPLPSRRIAAADLAGQRPRRQNRRSESSRRRRRRLLPRGDYVCLPQCGHAPQMERPWLTNRLVLHFLTSLQPSAKPLCRVGYWRDQRSHSECGHEKVDPC